MKLILRKSVEHLGEAGDVITVKPGYGRNYLIPQGLAYRATDANLARLEAEQHQAEQRARRDYLEAKRRASQLEGVVLSFKANAGEEGKLFGSITSSDITNAITERGIDFELDRRRVQLDEPLKTIGIFNVPVRLHSEVEVAIEVHVEREDS
jgi:large subunit ribosomal protein L9